MKEFAMEERVQNEYYPNVMDVVDETAVTDNIKNADKCHILVNEDPHKSSDSDQDTLGPLGSPLLQRAPLIKRSVSSDSSSSESSKPHVTVRQISTSSSKKHTFTVVNYGSQDISDIPASPDSLLHLNDIFPRRLSKTSQPLSHSNQLRHSDFSPRGSQSMLSNDLLESQNASSVSPVTSVQYKNKEESVVDFCNNEIQDSGNSIDSMLDKKYTLFDYIKRGKLFASRKKNRLMKKNGEVNLSITNVNKRSLRFFQDMFTTLLDAKWRYLLLLFLMAFLSSWLIFALAWWIMAVTDKRQDVIILEDNVTQSITTCLDGVDSFASAILFSIETQHTIGYGTRSVTPQCPMAIIIVMLQSLVGVLLSCVTTGLIFAKFARPKRRRETVLFSDKAVICEKDGRRFLVFRVGDMRKSHMILVNIRAVLIKQHKTKEGEVIQFYQHNLHIQSEAEDIFFMAWPIKAFHIIDEKSPLWDLSEVLLLTSQFEILVIFEGTNATTGQATQVRTSYLPGEILWGHKLEPLLTEKMDCGQIRVDYTKFHETAPVEIAPMSARDLAEHKHRKNGQPEKKRVSFSFS